MTETGEYDMKSKEAFSANAATSRKIGNNSETMAHAQKSQCLSNG